MKALILIPCIWAAAALIWFFTIGAEIADSQPDPPTVETSIAAACNVALDVALASDVIMTQCRRAAEPVVSGASVIETVRIKDVDGIRYVLQITLRKSAWVNTAFRQVS